MIREPWGCCGEPNGDGGFKTQNVTPIIQNNTSAGQAMVAMKLYNSMLFSIVYIS
jgi:hypothetical protein